MRALKAKDEEAAFRFFGGDLMAAEGGTLVKHYRELAYMGFIPVLLHLRTILRNMTMCKRDISQWQPDVVILVDYPGFNLSIAKYLRQQRQNTGSKTPKVCYYIAPKIWAWKEYRIKSIRRDVDELFSILPFEVDFFEKKHHYPIHYVGNPTASEVREFLKTAPATEQLSDTAPQQTAQTSPVARPVIALLAGSRRQEINENLPAMIKATRHLTDRYDLVLAGAPSIPQDYYEPFLQDSSVRLVMDKTYPLLAQATAALVTSGTATLETCMFGVPQVVCYRTPMPRFFGILRKFLLKVRYVSLVNLIADREVVPELVANTFSVENIRRQLEDILPGGIARQRMLDGYDEVYRRLGESEAPEQAAEIIAKL